jgi:hypothetical protein
VNASLWRLPDRTHHSRPRRPTFGRCPARSYLVRLFHSLLSSGIRRRTLTPYPYRRRGIDIVLAPRDKMDSKWHAEVAAIRLGKSGSQYCRQGPIAIGTNNYHCRPCMAYMTEFSPNTIQVSQDPIYLPKSVYPPNFVGPLPPGAVYGPDVLK